jgi:hypothetical protein
VCWVVGSGIVAGGGEMEWQRKEHLRTPGVLQLSRTFVYLCFLWVLSMKDIASWVYGVEVQLWCKPGWSMLKMRDGCQLNEFFCVVAALVPDVHISILAVTTFE